MSSSSTVWITVTPKTFSPPIHIYIQVLALMQRESKKIPPLASKLAPLQTSEPTNEVNPEKVARVWVLYLPTCIASYGSAMSSGDKHLIIVRTFQCVKQLEGVKGAAVR